MQRNLASKLFKSLNSKFLKQQSCIKTIDLANGTKIPAIGFGTAFMAPEEEQGQRFLVPEEGYIPIDLAIKSGYNHLDCAVAYGTHQILGNAIGREILQGNKTRKDFFVTTKLFHPSENVGMNKIGRFFDVSNPKDVQERIFAGFEKSLLELNLGYVNMLLIHWPGKCHTTDEAYARQMRKEVWLAFEEIYKSKKALAIGVCNYNVRHLETMIQDTNIKPMLNQIECNPYLQQKQTVKFCQQNEIVVGAWSPFGNGKTNMLKDEVLIKMAAKYNKNVGQLCLRFLNQQGIVVLPRSNNADRMKSNLNIFDFDISQDDMQVLINMDRGKSWIEDMPVDSIA